MVPEGRALSTTNRLEVIDPQGSYIEALHTFGSGVTRPRPVQRIFGPVAAQLASSWDAPRAAARQDCRRFAGILRALRARSLPIVVAPRYRQPPLNRCPVLGRFVHRSHGHCQCPAICDPGAETRPGEPFGGPRICGADQGATTVRRSQRTRCVMPEVLISVRRL
jgi:hypothetical protein